MRSFLFDPCDASGITRLYTAVEEAFVCFTGGERTRPAQPQSLVDGVLQPTIRRLDIAVLRRVAGEVARSAQTIMISQLAIPFGELAPAALCQFMGCRRQVIGAVLDRHTTEPPKRRLHASTQGFKTLARANRYRLPVRVRQHKVIQ